MIARFLVFAPDGLLFNAIGPPCQPEAAWHACFPDPTIGDAILDRLIHNAYRLNLQGESRRRIDSPLPMSST